ncbi:MAG: hypothetical protein QOJ02_3416 [Acidobacteriota bacterium]|nr:hypothetical protein [Acidobacteriota bacterium]
MIGAVFIDAASGRSITMFLEEGALEKNLATGSATIAFALTKRKGSDDLLLAEVCADETAELALRLPRAKLRVLDGARAARCGETLFQRTLSWGTTLTQIFHKVRC